MKSSMIKGLLGVLMVIVATASSFAGQIAVQHKGESVAISVSSVKTQAEGRDLILAIEDSMSPNQVLAIVEGDFEPTVKGKEVAVLGFTKRPGVGPDRAYTLFVMTPEENCYRILEAAKNVVNPEAVYTAPARISAQGNVLIIDNEFGSRERTYATLKFRYEANPKRIVLIGLDVKYVDTIDPKAKPQKASLNILTGKVIANGKSGLLPKDICVKNSALALKNCSYGGVDIDIFGLVQ